MIKLRQLLCESVGGITSSTIYNFYYMWHLFVTSPELFKTEIGKYILDEYLKSFKSQYINLFKQLMAEQLVKYVSRGRVDPDFDKSKVKPTESALVLWKLMEKTLRSDMKRRNDVWNLVGEYLTNLESATSQKDILLYVDRLNSCVHNTSTLILGKLSGGSDLMRSYNTAKNTDPKYWSQYVSKDLRQVATQDIYELKQKE